ncbi:MAG: 2OG-Fe(II) oxygenase family protein [Pseudomonadota bacterium]
MPNIPTLDFSSYDAESPAALGALAVSVDDAFSTVGFMAVRNLGVDHAQLGAVFDAAQAFFAGAPEDKQRSAYGTAADNFGYQCSGDEHLDPTAPADLKETFTMRDVGRRGVDEARWPSPVFAQLMRAFYASCLEGAFRLMHVMALALDTEPNFFARCHHGENVTMRLLHYPAYDPESVQPRQLGAGAHTDYGLLTLLFQQDTPGLEVQDPSGVWLPVAADPGRIIINAGDLLQVWTNGRYRSTLHRVQPQLDGRSRQSIAVFIDPDSATEVSALPSCTSADNPPRFKPTTAGAHLQSRIEASHRTRL